MWACMVNLWADSSLTEVDSNQWSQFEEQEAILMKDLTYKLCIQKLHSAILQYKAVIGHFFCQTRGLFRCNVWS